MTNAERRQAALITTLRNDQAYLGERLLDLTTGAISSLSFGVAEGVLADGLATSWHTLFLLFSVM